MTISFLELVVITLAAGAVIDVWHNGAIFATWRAIVQAKQDVAAPGTFQAWWTELLTCPFCQSYHVAFYLLILLLSGKYIGGMFDLVGHLLLYSLAITRLSNILNGVLPEKTQYDRQH
jgi:hypothetical protein